MGSMLKIIAVLIVVGGIWVWATGRSVTEERQARVSSTQLSASAILAPGADRGSFDERGTIIVDQTQGQGGTPYLLYAEYDASGNPAVKTKRLVFQNGDECAERNLPCATNQPGVPVVADEEVRVIGIVRNELVEVRQIYRL